MQELTKLWTHQKDAVAKARGKNFHALFFEMGCGKTATAINILREKYYEWGMRRTLIFCPPIVIENWKREWAMHSKIKLREIILLQGSQKKRLSLMADALQGLGSSKICITNYESLIMDELFAAFMYWKPEILVFDESHKLKTHNSQRTKAATKLSRSANFRYLLTGTPVLNTPMDLYAPYKIMDGGQTFGDNYLVFRNTYFYDKNAGMPQAKYFPNWVVRPGAIDIINAKLEATSSKAKKADCLDLPPMVREERFVELSSEQRRLYEQMKKDFITYMDGKAAVAQIALTKLLRLMQIVSGFVTVEGENDREDIVLKENPRAEALKELLAEITTHSKVLIWAVFKQNYKAIKSVCDALGLNYRELHGETPAKDRQKNVDDFNNDPSVNCMVANPGSGGIGVNLTAASYSIFYSRNFSLEFDLQAEARNHRGGSEIHSKITRIDLIAKDTIDELILQRLHQKSELSEKILHEIVRELKGGKDVRGSESTIANDCRI